MNKRYRWRKNKGKFPKFKHLGEGLEVQILFRDGVEYYITNPKFYRWTLDPKGANGGTDILFWRYVE